MIFYPSETKAEAVKKAISDPQWSESEKKALAEILRFVEVEEENQSIMASDEWINNPVDLSAKYPGNIGYGKWVNGQDLYATRGQKYMIEFAGTGYRIGKCYPEPH
jgi:hypothetical protein